MVPGDLVEVSFYITQLWHNPRFGCDNTTVYVRPGTTALVLATSVTDNVSWSLVLVDGFVGWKNSDFFARTQ